MDKDGGRHYDKPSFKNPQSHPYPLAFFNGGWSVAHNAHGRWNRWKAYERLMFSDSIDTIILTDGTTHRMGYTESGAPLFQRPEENDPTDNIVGM